MVREHPLQISCKELKQYLDNKTQFLLIDVREKEEVEKTPIHRAKNIPLLQLKEKVFNFPKNKDIIIICSYGYRSLIGCFYLREHGFKRARSLNGGVQDMLKHNLKL